MKEIEILKEKKLPLFKKWGQSFLKSKKILKKIVKEADISFSDVVLEVGAGIGNLTEFICNRAKEVIAVEKDERLIPFLKENLKTKKNVKIIKGDILKISLSLPKKYKVLGNLPYSLATRIIKKFLKQKKPPLEMVVMVQKELAQRICARAPKMNFLALSIQFFGSPKILFFVSKKHFWPQPKVDSAVIKIFPKKEKEVREEVFFKIAEAGFSHPRKKIVNNLSTKLNIPKKEIKKILEDLKISPSLRPQHLSFSQWKKICLHFQKEKV